MSTEPKYRSTAYHEIELTGGGVMRVEVGDIVCLEDGAPVVMPPVLFADAQPDFDTATLPVSRDGRTIDEPVAEPALEPEAETPAEPAAVVEDAPAPAADVAPVEEGA